MTALIPIDHLIGSVPFSQVEWDQTPSLVQAHLAALKTTVHTLEAQLQQLQQQVEQLQGRLDQTSSTSNKPPSSNSPFKKRKPRHTSGKRGGKKGHPGAGPKLLETTDGEVVLPPSCSCGHAVVSAPTPYRTHQVLELPPIKSDVTHFILHQSTCLGCGQTLRAEVPPAHATGYGPRLSALIVEMAGIQGRSRRLIQDFCHTVSLFLIHPNRSKAAFFELIDDWSGLLVSDGYGVYQDWVNRRQTCLTHWIHSARGLSTKRDPALAACGKWALRELQRLCHMAKAPPRGRGVADVVGAVL